ncbi:hypothetical protein COU56_02895 [Candidatus Pacearchaeota archaeon CG10_big_fil_rev_8_21_14_0_10_31_9]|nr:MAG: hypothetical protein COU56_02895 [Candidatus Pacearchaeota archaeon CG10_big_fil_rev_8_21_14_0_10_31_9]PIZ83245.1 MAG: hypothetical protein COX97_01410 [Candidatus Pacearchaeota archaeon CG_4_10_14_0_2_um_filter_05_32_18]
MRQIKTQKEIEKKQNRNKVIIAFVFIGLMVLSTAGFALFSGTGISNKNVKNYNGMEFSLNENGYWEFQIQGQNFQTSYTPEETEQISADFISINEINGKPLYFFNPDASSLSEIVYNLGRYASRYQEVCLDSMPCNNPENVVKTCDDSVIVFRESNESSVIREGNCIFLNSSPGNEVLVSNRLIFKALGVQ